MSSEDEEDQPLLLGSSPQTRQSISSDGANAFAGGRLHSFELDRGHSGSVPPSPHVGSRLLAHLDSRGSHTVETQLEEDGFEEQDNEAVLRVVVEDDYSSDDEVKPGFSGRTAAFRREAWRLLAMSAPLSVTYLLGYGASVISTIFVGHLGRYELAVAVLATSFFNVTGYAPLTGLATGMETLCGQAYGAKRYATVGFVLQRALLICTAYFIFMLPVWLHIEPFLVWSGQDPHIAKGAARYLIISIPALLFQSTGNCIHRWGLDGASLANDLIAGTNLLGLVSYMIWREKVCVDDDDRRTWQGWSSEAFKGWGQFMRIAFPSMAMVCMEWVMFEVMVLLAGLLPNPDLAVSTIGITFQWVSLLYMLSYALSGAVSTRISNSLGAGHPKHAALSALAAVILTLLTTSTAGAVLWWQRVLAVRIFTNDPLVVATTASIMPLLALSLVGDGCNATLSGVVRGAGQQALGAKLNVFCYWVLGVPLSALLAFRAGLHVHGLWAGLLLATSLQASLLAVCVYRFDWNAEAKRAAQLVKAADGHRHVPVDDERGL